MTNLSYLALVLLLQQGSPSWQFPGLMVAVGVLGFLAGSLFTTIFFLAKRRENPTNSFQDRAINNVDKRRVSIKHCSQCDSTYTDEELGYCLRDGTLLKIVGTMPAAQDPDETVFVSRNR